MSASRRSRFVVISSTLVDHTSARLGIYPAMSISAWHPTRGWSRSSSKPLAQIGEIRCDASGVLTFTSITLPPHEVHQNLRRSMQRAAKKRWFAGPRRIPHRNKARNMVPDVRMGSKASINYDIVEGFLSIQMASKHSLFGSFSDLDLGLLQRPILSCTLASKVL